MNGKQKIIALVATVAMAIAIRGVLGGDTSDKTAATSVNAVTVKAAEPAKAAIEKPTAILASLAREPIDTDGVDLFAPKSWYVAPPPAKPAPPPKPTAPPLPFTYIGQFEGKSGLVIFLTRGNEFISAQSGQQLDQNYVLESVAPDQLVFKYLPLQEEQRIVLGGK